MRRQADFVALVVKAPRTVNEVAELVGANKETVRAWVQAFADEGLVRQGGLRKSRTANAVVWEWAA
jgi:transposase-like protein